MNTIFLRNISASEEKGIENQEERVKWLGKNTKMMYPDWYQWLFMIAYRIMNTSEDETYFYRWEIVRTQKSIAAFPPKFLATNSQVCARSVQVSLPCCCRCQVALLWSLSMSGLRYMWWRSCNGARWQFCPGNSSFHLVACEIGIRKQEVRPKTYWIWECAPLPLLAAPAAFVSWLLTWYWHECWTRVGCCWIGFTILMFWQ